MDSDSEYNGIGFQKGETQQNNVIMFLKNHAERNALKVALTWVDTAALKAWDGESLPHVSIPYGELYQKIKAIAAGLHKIGVRKGDRVIIFVPLSLELYLTMFAVQYIGAIAVFLDSWARRDHLSVSANVVQPKAMISFEKAFQLCATVPELNSIPLKVIVGLHQDQYTIGLARLLEIQEEKAIEPVKGQDTALITFTTGSSGVPKGANRTHRFLAAQHQALDKVLPYIDQDIDLPVFPIFSLNNLAGGVSTVLPAIDLAAPSEQDAAMIVNQFFSCQVRCCTVSPSIFVNIAAYCRQNKILLKHLRRVVTGGAPVSKDNVRDFKAIAPNAKIWVLYGSTEVEPIAHIEAEDMLSQGVDSEGVNVGNFSDDLDYKFIRIHKGGIDLESAGWPDWELSSGSIGELIVSGAHVCEEYYNDPESTKKTKIRDKTGTIWHRTGDVGRLDKEGNLWLVGRVHNTIVRDNEYLFPVHAEILLKKLPFVKQAAFLGLEDKTLGEKTFAVVSLREETPVSDQGPLRDQIRAVFKEKKIPLDEVRIIEEIPMDPRHHSKVEYATLRTMLG